MTAPRTYRLSPPDRTGWLLGLGAAQVTSLGLALVTGVLMLSAGAAMMAIAVPAGLGLVVGFGRLNGRPIVDSMPAAIRLVGRLARRSRPWLAPLPLLPVDGHGTPPLPPCLDGQVVLAADAKLYGPSTTRPIGIVYDRRGGTYAATLRVSGREFTLLPPTEQDRVLSLWGDALAAFCRERTAVTSVRWSEWTAPAGMEEQHAFLADHGAAEPTDPARLSYEALLATAGPLATRHEVLVTVTVTRSGVTVASRHRGNEASAAIDVLLDELRLFGSRLADAGLAVSTPLSPAELARVVRTRLDPSTVAALDRRGRSLGDRAGLVHPTNSGPLATACTWSHWQVDGALHRAFYVADWPRLDVPADWMRDLLLRGDAVRTVTVCYEPVAPRVSQRTIERQAAKLESDEDQRRRTGFRVGAHHRRAFRAVEEREEELVAGYAELEYVGLVNVAALDHDALEKACSEMVQLAAGVGVELRPLDGRHDQGVAASLPLARALAPRGVRR